MLTIRHVLQRVVQTAEEVVQEVAAGQETLRTNPAAFTLKLKGTDESRSLFCYDYTVEGMIVCPVLGYLWKNSYIAGAKNLNYETLFFTGNFASCLFFFVRPGQVGQIPMDERFPCFLREGSG